MMQKQTQRNTQAQQTTLEQGHPGGSGALQGARSAPGQRRVHRCANCEIEFFWSPTVVQNSVYCCTGCAAAGPCTCDYSLYRSVTIMGVIHYE